MSTGFLFARLPTGGSASIFICQNGWHVGIIYNPPISAPRVAAADADRESADGDFKCYGGVRAHGVVLANRPLGIATEPRSEDYCVVPAVLRRDDS